MNNWLELAIPIYNLKIKAIKDDFIFEKMKIKTDYLYELYKIERIINELA